MSTHDLKPFVEWSEVCPVHQINHRPGDRCTHCVTDGYRVRVPTLPVDTDTMEGATDEETAQKVT